MAPAMYFASDNWSGVAPQILDAVAREAAGFGNAYGESRVDRAAASRFSEVFERDVAVFLVGTGSAANALGLASVNKPGGVVFCHRESHIVEDECGAVEYLTGGSRLIGVPGSNGKIAPKRLRSALARFAPGFVHSGQPMALSLTQMTEAGTVYTTDEIRDLVQISAERGLPVHMDGARFANALVRLGVSPAEMTWKAGVDILSFGGTKNGCMAAEALIFFDPNMARDAPYLRKRAGQLFSKSRFIAAQFEAYLAGGLWLDLARHSNAMADRLRDGFTQSPNARLAWRTDGNEVFVVLRLVDAERLKQAGAVFHNWGIPQDASLEIGDDQGLFRFVTSFQTRREDIEAFLSALVETEATQKTQTPRQSRGAVSA